MTTQHPSSPDRLRRLVQDVPDLASGWILLAEALEQDEMPEEAADAWRVASVLVPNSPKVIASLRRLGITEAGLPASRTDNPEDGQVDDAEPAPAEGAQSGSLDLDTLIAELQKGRSVAGEVEPETADDQDKAPPFEDEPATTTLAEIFVDQNHVEEAIRIYEKLVDRATSSEEVASYLHRISELRRLSS